MDYKGAQGNFLSDKYVCYLHCSKGFRHMSKHYQITHFKHVQFIVHQSHFRKTINEQAY